MRRSITSRLTRTSAILTACVLLPLGGALYFAIPWLIHNDSAAAAQSDAKSLAFRTLYNLDEDLLVEGNPLALIDVHSADWALVRGNGQQIHSHGIFRDSSSAELFTDGAVLRLGGRPWRIVGIPLVSPQPERFEDLPEAVRVAVRKLSPNGVFLRAKREVAKKSSFIAIEMLEPHHILEIEVAYDGTIIEHEPNDFDQQVPDDLLALLHPETRSAMMSFSSWAVYNGELIGIVRGRGADGFEFEVALNRLGERFRLSPDGSVVEPDPDWRIWLWTAVDASGETLAVSRLYVLLTISLPTIWFAVVFLTWYVTRRALPRYASSPRPT